MRVLDYGEVELVSANASDLSVVAAARVSHGVEYANASKGPQSDERLIRYLMEHDHGTPFEHNLFTFYVKAPIFVVREWHRHRVGWSYNEVSGRYTELPEEYYVPVRIRVAAPKNRQGSVPLPEADWLLEGLASYEITSQSMAAHATYRRLLEAGVARELARLVLPLNTYTAFYATCNARSLMHFLRLRQAEDAQWEIRQYADAMAAIFAETMPITARAFRSTTASTHSTVASAPDSSATVGHIPSRSGG